jgi:hypothetical protein
MAETATSDGGAGIIALLVFQGQEIDSFSHCSMLRGTVPFGARVETLFGLEKPVEEKLIRGLKKPRPGTDKVVEEA